GYLSRRSGVAAAEQRVAELAGRLAAEPRDADEYATALERLLALAGGDFDARVRAVCADLGLPASALGRPLAELSGGERTRAALAAILLARFDVFLLDEPTNDLDFAGLRRLERFVADFDASFVIVSHDRAFLEA